MRLRTWFTRRWCDGRGFRIATRSAMGVGWGAFSFLCRYTKFQQVIDGTGDWLDYLVGACLLLAFLSSSGLSLLSWLASDDADEERKVLQLRAVRAEEITKDATLDLQYNQMLLNLIGKVVELKADHALEQLTKKKGDRTYEVEPYDPWDQIEKILETVVVFFGEHVIDESKVESAEVFGAYFTVERDYLVCKFSKATRDATWTAGDVGQRYRERFNLTMRPAPSAAVYAAAESGNSLYMIADCEAAHADAAHRFQYFEQPREQPKNKSMMCYVVRDAKDHNQLRGEFCVYTNVKGFFDTRNHRIGDLCESFMREMTQRVIYEYRQLDLTQAQNGA